MKPNKTNNPLGLTDAQIAEFFGYKNAPSFYTSSARDRIKTGVKKVYEHIKTIKK